MNTITSPTLLREQTRALKKHFLGLKHLKHIVHKLSAPASSPPKVGALDVLPIQEEVPSGTDRSLTCVQVIAIGSFTQPFQSYGGKKAITGKHRGKRHLSLLKHPIPVLEHECGAKSRCYRLQRVGSRSRHQVRIVLPVSSRSRQQARLFPTGSLPWQQRGAFPSLPPSRAPCGAGRRGG